MIPPGWWELDVVAAKLGIDRARNCTRLVERLVRDGLIAPNEFRSRGSERTTTHIRAKNRRQAGLTPSTDKGGRPRELIYLSPVAVIVVAAHARTPEAAAFRQEAITKLAEQARAALPDDIEAFVAEVEARANKATPGPWDDLRVGRVGDGSPLSAEEQLCNSTGVAVVILTHDGSAEAIETVNFIANTRTDIPRLVAIVREQGAQIANRKTRLSYIRSALSLPNSISIVDHGKQLIVRVQRLEAERDALRALLDKLEGCTLSNPNGTSLAALLLGELRELLNEKGGA